MVDYWRTGAGVGMALALVAAVSAPAGAQTYYACYVRGTGTVYRIREPGLQTDCRKDVPFNWTDGAGALRPGSSAGGDLSGTLPNPLVVGLRGRLIDATTPTDGQILRFDGASGTWKPVTPAGGGGVTDHGQLTGLADDDHLQYLLADGVRQTVNGFAVTGTLGGGVIPASGPGVRLLWNPGKAAFRAGSVDGTQWDGFAVGRYSAALGANTRATGDYSTAMGQTTLASADNATAMGLMTTASGASSTAMGDHTTASGDNSTAMGLQTVASGPTSTAMGQASRAEGERSTAMGGSTLASGSLSTAMGGNATASGVMATAMGSQTVASGYVSTAMGSGTRAEGDYSTAMGNGSSASGNNSMAIGANSTASGPSSTAIDGGTASATDALAIGNLTTANADHSTAMGYSASTNGQAGSFVFGDFTGGYVQATTPNQFVVRASGGFQFRTSTDLLTGCNLPPSSGSWDCSSSVTLKTAFEPVDGEDVLARVRQLPVERWSYRGEVGVRHMGTFAEDFHRAFGLGTGDKTIGMIDMDGVNLAAVQALERRTRALQAELETYKSQLTQRDRQIDGLERQVAELARRLGTLEAMRQ